MSQVASAQVSPAADALARATQGLEEASGARDRVAALTSVVQGFEQGLGEVRDNLRRAKLQEAQVQARLDVASEDLAALLAVMSSISQARMPASLLHPEGALGTARAGILLQSVGPALQEEAAQLRADLEEAQSLRFLQEDALERLMVGLADVRRARTELSQAISERRDRPRPYAEDPVRMAALIEASETLDAFATSLIIDGPAVDQPDILDQKGSLPLPVRGVLLRGFGETDAAGVARPGWILATEPGAVVTTPTSATLRYVGPFPGFDHVAVLEPAPGMLLILAGLAEAHGTAGEVLAAGDPVGFMARNDENLSGSALSTGRERSETLYIELKQDQIAVDPKDWFDG